MANEVVLIIRTTDSAYGERLVMQEFTSRDNAERAARAARTMFSSNRDRGAPFIYEIVPK